MRLATSIVLLSVAALSACTNSSVPQDWHRSRPVAEGRRPSGLPGVPVEPVSRHGDRSLHTSPAKDPRSLAVFDGHAGHSIGWFDLVSRAAHADIVLIGEIHGDATAQAMLTTFWEDLAAYAPTVWLALEFFERDQQTAIDDYLAGVTTEDEFRKVTGRNSANYPEGHRAMVERAKKLGRPVIAANAPRRYARLARTAGYERLSSLAPDTQRLFVIPESLTEGRYREEFEGLMRESLKAGSHTAAERKEQQDASRHGDTTREPHDLEEKVRGYFRSQNLWDATMADSVTRPAMAGARPVVLVVGRFHTDHNGGLTDRIRSYSPNLRVLTISLSDEAPSSDGTLRPDDSGRADAVVYLR